MSTKITLQRIFAKLVGTPVWISVGFVLGVSAANLTQPLPLTSISPSMIGQVITAKIDQGNRMIADLDQSLTDLGIGR